VSSKQVEIGSDIVKIMPAKYVVDKFARMNIEEELPTVCCEVIGNFLRGVTVQIAE